jgi:DNA-binding transcriptional regulator YdaS (Cro superfamily)
MSLLEVMPGWDAVMIPSTLRVTFAPSGQRAAHRLPRYVAALDWAAARRGQAATQSMAGGAEKDCSGKRDHDAGELHAGGSLAVKEAA